MDRLIRFDIDHYHCMQVSDEQVAALERPLPELSVDG